MMADSTTKNGGFTLVELMTVVPICLLVISVIFAYMITLYVDNLVQINRLMVIDDTNRTLNLLDQDLSVATGFLTTNAITDPSGPPSGGAWAGNSASPYSTLIVKNIATTENLSSDTKQLVRENTFGCDADNFALNQPHYTNVIYFVNDKKLYRRTLVQSSPPALCGVSFQKTTCTTTSPTCEKDTLLMSDVEEFRVRYGRAPVGFESCTDDSLRVCNVSLPTNASVVTVYLTLSRMAAGEQVSYGHRATLRAINAPRVP